MPILHLASQHLLKSFASAVRQDLPVGKGIISSTAHGTQIILTFGRAERCTYQLTVHQVDAEAMHCRLELLHVIGTDLVTKAARAAMDLDSQCASFQTHDGSCLGINDLLYPVDF